MPEQLSCEECGKWFASAGALRLHRYADHGIGERPPSSIPREAPPDDPGRGPAVGRKQLGAPKRRRRIAVVAVVAVALGVVGALWAGGYLSDGRPQPIEVEPCLDPDVAAIEQLETEWALHGAKHQEDLAAAEAAGDDAAIQDLLAQHQRASTAYDSAMTQLLNCVPTTWDLYPDAEDPAGDGAVVIPDPAEESQPGG